MTKIGQINYLSVPVPEELFERLNFYARHQHDRHKTAEGLASDILVSWIVDNTDPVVVKYGIARLVKNAIRKAIRR